MSEMQIELLGQSQKEKRRLYIKQWQKNNRTKRRIIEKRWREKNQEAYKSSRQKQAKAYYLKNRERIIAQAIEYQKQNPEKCKAWQRTASKKPKPKAYRAKWMREWRKKNPEKAKAANARRPPRPQEEIDRKNAKQRERYDPMKEKFDRIALKKEIFAAYGGAFCKCCPENNPDKYTFEFLSIDHINGGGVKHRKEIGVTSGDGFYKWLKKNNYPSGFQVLCHNCNKAKWAYGKCPHQKKLITGSISTGISS